MNRQTDYSGPVVNNTTNYPQHKEITTTQRIGLIGGVDCSHCVAACFCFVVTGFRCVLLILLCCSLFPLCCANFVVLQLVSVVLQLVSILLC